MTALTVVFAGMTGMYPVWGADAPVHKTLNAEAREKLEPLPSNLSTASSEELKEFSGIENEFQRNPGDTLLLNRYLKMLVRLRFNDKARKVLTSNLNQISESKSSSLEIGKAFFEAGDYIQALNLYKEAFRLDPSESESLKGIISSACRTGDYMTAYKYWTLGRDGQKIPYPILRDLGIQMAQEMGSPVLALQYARESGMEDKKRLEALESEMRAEQMSWEEALEPMLQNCKSRQEYIIALGQKHRMREVLDQYKILEKQGEPCQLQTTITVADAFSYLKRPQEAEKFYNMSLSQNPSEPFRSYLGLLRTYTIMRKWDDGDKILAKIQDLFDKNKLSWMEQHEAVTAHGWYLIAQDRLGEAQNLFENNLREAGLDSGFRSGLAHVYYYRGWPRKALEQFRISQSIDPENVSCRVGLVQTMEKLDYNREAGALASELYRNYPYDLDVIDIYDEMKIKNAVLVSGSARLIDELPGVTEYRFQLEGSFWVKPELRIFADLLHMHAHEDTDEGELASTWNRIGAGFSWIVTPGLTFTQAGSWDYSDSADFGSTTKISWNPDDHLTASIGFESFSLDIPLRARAAGVQGKTGVAEVAYHESDLRDYSLAFQSNWLNDGNYNPAFIFNVEQTIISRPDWKLQAGPEIYYARYSKDQDEVPYYSPMYVYSLVLKPVLQITHYQRYDKSFRSYIQADAGIIKQHRNGFYPTGGITYAQEIKTSKSFNLNWMAGYGARVYDGRYSHVLELFLGINKYF
jgi:tetratricopeptide (TPR) repeat protein